ncbi:MAG: TrkA C-terminal domain-containing protein [Acidimicrobiales bacterium]
MAPPRLVVGDRLSAVDASRALAAVGVTGAPVVDREGRFEGTVILQDLAAASGAHQGLRGLVDAGAPTVTATSTLDVAVHALTTSRASFVPVVDDERRVLGTLAVSDLARACGARLRARLRAHEPPGTAVHEIEADPGSPVAGRRLRDAALPDGVVVMAIQRHGVVLTPTGDTVIEPGDLLSVIGGAAGGENGVTDIV